MIAHAPAVAPVVLAPRRIPVWPGMCVAGAIGVIYLAVASQGTFHFGQSLFPHHVLVADAWLHGQLNIRNEVLDQRNEQYYRELRASAARQFASIGRTLTDADWEAIRGRFKAPLLHDWAVIGGRYYGYWPPMVSALLVPYVAVAGTDASDILFSCLVGTLTVLLMYLGVREADRTGYIKATAPVCAAAATLLGLGTVHFYLTVVAQVWFLSQVVGAMFLTLATWLALRRNRRPIELLVAGLALAAAVLSRNTLIMTLPFFCIVVVVSTPLPHSWRVWARRLACFCAPLCLAGAANLLFNYARFGRLFDSGQVLTIVTGGNEQIREDFVRYGLFSPHYLMRNAYYYFLNAHLPRDPRTGSLTFDPIGNSMFLVSPALLYSFAALRRPTWFVAAAWSGAACGLLTVLLYVGTGWYQFGNRYLLDVIPLLILLVSAGMRGKLGPLAVLLIGASIAVNCWGTYRFCAEQF